MTAGLDVPELVRLRALSGGAAGRRWLDELPDVVAPLASRWELELGAPYAGGTASYVAAAIRADGTACVLKVALPLDTDDEGTFARAVLVHRLADGRGCARLLAEDPTVPALLVERLGPNLHELGLPIPRILDTLADTLRAFWRPAAPDLDLPTGPEKAAWLAEYVTATWDRLGGPCPRLVVDRALDLCAARAGAFDPTTAVVVHGDAHGWNALRADKLDGTVKFVDPEGLRSEPAHDLAVPMREYNEPLLAGDTPRLVRERAERLAARAGGLDPEPVLEWGFVERVSTGLANVEHFGADGDGDAFLEVAARCC